MLNLLYTQRAKAKQSIEYLEGLVAILTQRTGPEMLFVYLLEALPVIENKSITTILLRDLPSYDISRYAGLLIGFNALDVLRNDLTTKGPFFYTIDRIFMECSKTDHLYRTMANLSIDLMRRLKEISGPLSRAQCLAIEGKALQLALPGMLQDRNCAGLVAILPVGELNRFIFRKSCHYLYCNTENTPFVLNDPLLNTRQNWVIALEELALLCPDIQPETAQFLDLRTILRGMQREDMLQVTRKKLAELFYQSAHQDKNLRHPAWALAIEYWLVQIECEDLVAFCPHNDFERFLELGDSIRVYRTLENDNQFLTSFPTINQSLHDVRQKQLPKGYGEVIFSLPGIKQLIRSTTDPIFFDLSKVLYNAGHEKKLARSLWLLSHDLLHDSPELNKEPAEIRKEILDACSRACLIYNLSDPWEWRQGRWQLYLERAYQTRYQILKQAFLEQTIWENEIILDNYYQAITLWYGCATTTTLEKDIEDLLEKLHNFQRDIEGNPLMAQEFTYEIFQCNELKSIGECLLNRTSDDLIAQPEESETDNLVLQENVPSILRHATDLVQPLSLISPPCKLAARQLQAIRRKHQNLYTQERNIQRLIEQLEKLLIELHNRKHQFFIPIHEEKALIFAYEQEIRTIHALLLELETSAKLNMVLKNTWVDIHQPVHLTLEITNMGRVEANTLKVILDHPRGFQLLDSSPVREIAVLQPNAPSAIDYYIRPERIGAELRIEFSFSDRSGQHHKDTWTTYLNVRSLDIKPFQIKVNHYQFGRPIQDMTEFYGRRSELQNIFSLLQAGGKQNLLLRGPRRMGKTSLLYMLKIAITDHSARRFFEIPTEWDQELDRVHPVFLSLHSFTLMSSEDAANQFFRTLLERIGTSLNILPEVQEQIMSVYERRENEIGAVNAALEQIGKLLNLSPDQRITVLLDEYDEVYRPGTGNFDRHLREFVSAEQRMTWIISSTLALFQEVKTISSPWFNVFMIIELGRLSGDSAVELVEAPTRKENIFWRSDAILALLEETGRHPAFTQLFCGRVIAYLNQVKTNYVLRETIFSIADQIVDEQETANSHFEFFWQDTAGTGQLILLILDDQEQPLKRDEIHQRLRRILEEKFGHTPRQLIQNDGDPIEWQEYEFKSQIDWVEKITNAVSLDNQKRYFFTVPLFRRWLRRRRQYQNLEAETLEKIAREMENDGVHHDIP